MNRPGRFFASVRESMSNVKGNLAVGISVVGTASATKRTGGWIDDDQRE
jgi:hypothetical protein